MQTSSSVQDYLKAIYALGQSGPVTTSGLAARLQVTPASVTAMVKRLAGQDLLRHRRYRDIELTDRGRALALEVIRHHRLLEAYLHKALGMSWDKVHEEAEVLEHVLSEELEDRIAELLGHPTHDPHGDPIPPKRSAGYTEVLHVPLAEFTQGGATVERVSDRDPEALRYLDQLGLVPGRSIEVESREPFGGPVWVKVGRKRHAIGRELAATVYVSPASPADDPGSPGEAAITEAAKRAQRCRPDRAPDARATDLGQPAATTRGAPDVGDVGGADGAAGNGTEPAPRTPVLTAVAAAHNGTGPTARSGR
jgi:DtxR family Mn-dependent transcriptional regulator